MARFINPYGDDGPLPAGHTDVTGNLSDVAGPPAEPRRSPGVPMAAPTSQYPVTRSKSGGTKVGPVADG
jgi:hypothetical protein